MVFTANVGGDLQLFQDNSYPARTGGTCVRRLLLSSVPSIPVGQVNVKHTLIAPSPRQAGHSASCSSVQTHASISPLVGHAASLTPILSECVASGYSNLICKPLHGSYVTAGMSL